jgi:predicted nucleic acid-binding protein
VIVVDASVLAPALVDDAEDGDRARAEMWELHPTLTPYDAADVALAEVLESTLLTADRRLARASGPTCRFTVVG